MEQQLFPLSRQEIGALIAVAGGVIAAGDEVAAKKAAVVVSTAAQAAVSGDQAALEALLGADPTTAAKLLAVITVARMARDTVVAMRGTAAAAAPAAPAAPAAAPEAPAAPEPEAESRVAQLGDYYRLGDDIFLLRESAVGKLVVSLTADDYRPASAEETAEIAADS